MTLLLESFGKFRCAVYFWIFGVSTIELLLFFFFLRLLCARWILVKWLCASSNFLRITVYETNFFFVSDKPVTEAVKKCGTPAKEFSGI